MVMLYILPETREQIVLLDPFHQIFPTKNETYEITHDSNAKVERLRQFLIAQLTLRA